MHGTAHFQVYNMSCFLVCVLKLLVSTHALDASEEIASVVLL